MKSTVCIACVDAARARFFALESAERSTGDRVTRLVEVLDLVHPGRRQRPSEALSDSRPGLRQGSGPTGSGHGVDDHRGDKADESDREFAGRIVEALKSSVADLSANRVVVAASPRMLGWLREFKLADTAPKVEELDKNLTSLSAADLRNRLVEDGTIPATV